MAGFGGMLGGQVDKVVNTTFKWSGMVQGATGMQKLSLGATAVGAAVVAAGAALFRLADVTTRTFAQFEDMSERTGILASDLHALSIAAEQSGSDFEAITTGLRRMPSFLDDASQGMSTAATTMDRLGLSVESLQGLSIEDQFYTMVDALGAVQDESTRAALAQDVFGRGSMALVPLLEEGSDSLRGFADEARATGLVLGEDAYEAADKFQDAIALMKVQMQSALMDGIQPMLPQLQETAERLMDIASEAIPQMLEVMTTALPIIQRFAEWIGKVAEGWTLIAQMGENWDPTRGQFGISMEGVYSAEAAGMTTDPQMISREEYRVALGRSRVAIEEELAEKQADYAASLAEEADVIAGSGGGAADTSILDAERERNDLLDQRMQLLEKQRSLEDEKAAMAAEAAQAAADRLAETEQIEYDARLERLQNYADMTTQVMGMAWDSLFSDTRQSFGDMLKDMMMDLAKSGLINLIKKGLFGGATGGLGFLF
jgi:hypothetical protein